MNLNELLERKIDLTKQGQVVEAAELFFAENAETDDFIGVQTNGRDEMVRKMQDFTSGIQNVNGITYHNSAVNGNTTYAEFTFDFDMKDGSKVLWHEIIRSVWKDGKIVKEQYFKA
ncbi:MAG: hypothetical protein DWQ47_02390 [Acidobacteria bacterium]|nr:MAG: hypothetical protein DWQ32_05940 [Acidobacteriota bacterium]REK03083.1 MAG: hypothetical protein DWQ38_02375 [Acidobacteriota bacterium]REK15431.1 MAG: hypothetical protein DWQ43_11630 [Acidobacteriota bacterium]REK45782.1 MAG: hypothetical protein DWQ47_02390 [Acidobacteriota bacterium]